MGWSKRVRGLVAGLLVAVFGLSFLAAGLGIWLHRNTLREDVWADRIGTLGEEPEVQAALARYTTDQLLSAVNPEAFLSEQLPGPSTILAVPLSVAVEGYVADKVDEFFASERFAELWAVAATQAQKEAVAALRGEREAIDADREKVSINLLPIFDAVLREIATSVPGLLGLEVELPVVSFDEVPAEARQRLVAALGIEVDDDFGTLVVYDQGRLATAQRAIRLFDQVVVGAIVVALASSLAALWISPRGRRTAFQLLGGAALASIVVRRGMLILEREVLDLIEVDENRAAVDVVLGSVIDPLTTTAGTVLWALGFAALLLALTGPYRWAVELRGQAKGTASSLGTSVSDAARDPGVASFAQRNVDALRIGGYAFGAAVLWFAEVSWLTLALAALAVAAWQVVLGRLVVEPPMPTAPPPDQIS